MSSSKNYFRYRLSLDMGSSSIGWALINLNREMEPTGIIKTGVRIFSDGRTADSKVPMAVQRREARQARRMRDRTLRRMQILSDALKECGLLSMDDEVRQKYALLNPYELRVRALDEQLEPYAAGRAIFHLAKRRGFKSNRKVDKSGEESGKVALGAVKAANLMKEYGARTYGEMLWNRNKQRKRVRVRFITSSKKDPYDFYPLRTNIEDEFKAIWNAQAKFLPDTYTQDNYELIHRIIFFQRPLKPQTPGFCTFLTSEERALKASAAAQEFLMLSDLNNLQIKEADTLFFRPLMAHERDLLLLELNQKTELKFPAIRKLLIKRGFIEKDCVFNLESGTKKSLIGNVTNVVLGAKDCFGEEWYSMPNDICDEIVSLLQSNTDDNKLAANLTEQFGRTEQQARKILCVNLADGYIRLSKKALDMILPYMREGSIYSEACAKAGFEHHLPKSDELLDRLTYYGELLERYLLPGKRDEKDKDKPEKYHGKIANPTVHIALNELRKLVNTIINRYGHPDQIVIEVARDLPLGAEERNKLIRQQADNRASNDAIADELRQAGVPVSRDNMLRHRLWQEQGSNDIHRCVYSGDTISYTDIFTPDYEIDHILPYSKTFDNGISNKVLCKKTANQYKLNRAPYEAFGDSSRYNYAEILERAKYLPPNKRWRFEKGAMDRYDAAGGFMERQLNDTRYMSRVAREYLYKICKLNSTDSSRDVWVVNGALTALVRRYLGLDNILGKGGKNRNDHRHHAIDALVVGCISRSMIQKIHTGVRRYENERQHDVVTRVMKEMGPPWPRNDKLISRQTAFYNSVKRAIENIKVSHRPDHGKEGALHRETAYGMLPDGTLFTHEFENDVRVLKSVKNASNVIKIFKKGGSEPYKYFLSGSNLYVDIVEEKGHWKMYGTTMFDANRSGYKPEWIGKDGSEFIMRIYKTDILEINGLYYRVGKLAPTHKSVYLAEIHEGGKVSELEKDKKYAERVVSYLQKHNARRVTIDHLGRVHRALEVLPCLEE